MMKIRVCVRVATVGLAVGLVGGVSVGLLGGCSSVERSDRDATAKRYSGFGNYTRPITTDSSAAQEWFDQGIQLMYGFNHDEAIRSFEMAAEVDPSAAMAWWGVAYCQGININDPAMTEERSQRGREAADKALAALDDESAVEWALVEALSKRYAWPAPEDRSGLDQAYADAMGSVYGRFGGDGDVGTLYGESLMNLQPWDYWGGDGSPKGRILEVVEVLERVMREHPEHPGAKHFYIHAVEASDDPDRAVAAAEDLIDLVPGSGHLVHMPSHIFIRVGRYEDAAASNIAAIEADRAYFKDAPEPGLYAMYYGHNLHFLSYASMMSGNYERALKAARDIEAEMPEGALRAYAGLIDGIMPNSLHVMIRFGKWEEVLEEPDYPEYRLMSRATWAYSRSVACSALGRTEQARAEMAEFERRMAEVPEEWYVMNNPVGNILPIARAMMRGELLYREGRKEEAFAVMREGIEHEDRLIYDEPPAWMLPVRHALGALLVESGEYAQAEGLYREDLEINRGNGWALVGLREALVGQGKMGEAMRLDDPIAAAFADADTVVESSCFCAP
ncbi:MAG: tetratricopeptide repeat protein [Phycisphaerales bacterium]|nr:tetratricopeptide repeat protein [Phycisphaerales bacterium]